ncbi:hypothetical protein C8T65DRAFT_830584 [Cerioporus squamosus]|nr:hypothetical protein C8T65DRAFT_830584 [Cerioporus squamosus]
MFGEDWWLNAPQLPSGIGRSCKPPNTAYNFVRGLLDTQQAHLPAVSTSKPPTRTMNLYALLAILPFISATLGQGVISCQDDYDYNGNKAVPVHYPSISTPSTTYVGGPYNSHCGQIVGGGVDYTGNWESDTSPVTAIGASFWVTPDGCMNVEWDGVHSYCCPPGAINEGTTSCDYF